VNRLILNAVGGTFDNTVCLDVGPEGSAGVEDVLVEVEAAPINNADVLFAAGLVRGLPSGPRGNGSRRSGTCC
jgi:NADPH:quinone reductase-like Zn-dependent oxidoreductase